MQYSLKLFVSIGITVLSGCTSTTQNLTDSWLIDSYADWSSAGNVYNKMEITEDGMIEPIAAQAIFKANPIRFTNKRKAKEVVFKQSPVWSNWESVGNVKPVEARNAPVFLPIADGDYWLFAAYGGKNRVKPKKFKVNPGEVAEAMGGGYHAWHSTDMKSWEHVGPISRSNWVTTAEYTNGKFYIYYDHPNDEDPHLIIDSDLTDGKHKDLGMVFKDESHGSDIAVLRDDDGTFHIFYENWNPINARTHAWDSPLGGHVDSPDGINGFTYGELPPAIDERTKPTGQFSSYIHGSGREYKYQIHEPEQDAFGDYTAIKVGSQYYLFSDYDPIGKSMRVARWTSNSVNGQFQLAGEIGEDFHPDPTIGFAEGQFYLIVQRSKNDFVSPGPWVESVNARAGVDIDNDGEIDQWTQWQPVSEKYSHKEGFSRVVDTSPAKIDLTTLPEGYGFSFEFKTKDTTDNPSKPIMDRVEMFFE